MILKASNKTRVAFMGNPGYGGLILDALCSSNVEVVAVFHASQSRLHQFRRLFRRYARGPKQLAAGFSRLQDKLTAIGDEPFASSCFGKDVREIALARNLPLFDGSFVHHQDCPERLRSLAVDVILVASFSEFLPFRVIEAPAIAAINMHPALLPRYRGWCPEFSAILNGERRTGITYHLMEEKFDTGNILLQRELEIKDGETTLSLKERLARLAIDTIPDLIDLIEDGDLQGITQDNALASYCRLAKGFNYIDESKSVKQIQCLVNACRDAGITDRPYFYHNGHKLFALSHGMQGFPLRVADGVIVFDALRYKQRIYQGEALQKLRDSITPPCVSDKSTPTASS